MTARAHAVIRIEQQTGGSNQLQVVSGAFVYVYEAGTTTPLGQTMYAARSGSQTLSSPLRSDGDGGVEFYLEAGQRVTYMVTATPGSAPLTVNDYEVHWDPLDVALASTTVGISSRLDAVTLYADSYIQAGDLSDYECIERGIAALLFFGGGTLQLGARTYSVHRSINQLTMSNIWIRGAGMYATTVRPTANLNAGDDGVPGDPSQNNVFNASNATLSTHVSNLMWSDFTIDGSDMPGYDGLEYGWWLGQAHNGIETEDVDNPAVYRVRFVNLPSGVTFGSTIPNFAGAFTNGQIVDCVFENTPNSVMHHYRYGLDDVAPLGIAAQMGVMIGGRCTGNRFINCNGPAYAVVASDGFEFANNYVEGCGGSVYAVNGVSGTVNIGFGARRCHFHHNRSIGAGGYVLNGAMAPNFFNGGVGEPAATSSVFDTNTTQGTALVAYPGPPTLTSGVRRVNNSGKDAAVNFAGAGTITAIKVGDRNDGSQLVTNPNAIRSVVVPNGMGITVTFSGVITWVWAPARLKTSSPPSAPGLGASPFSVTNSTGVGQLVTILPTATSSAVALDHLSIPPATGVAFTVDSVVATPMGIRRNMLYLPNGSTLTMTWTTATVQAALRLYYVSDLILTGWEWRWDAVSTWTGQPAVPDSGGTIFNALGVPMAVEVLTGAFTAISVTDAAGNVTQTVQVTSAVTGLKHFIVEPGGSVTVTWVTTRPTWSCYAAPNGLIEQFYGHSGSTVSILGQAADNVVDGKFVQPPVGAVALYDFLRSKISIDATDVAEWREAPAISLNDTGVTGGGTKDTLVTGGHINDSRTTKTMTYAVIDNGANNTGSVVRSNYLSAVKAGNTAIGVRASRLDASGNVGPGAETGFLTPPAMPLSTAALTNPFPYTMIVIVSSGAVSAVAVDGTTTGLTTPSTHRLRVGGTIAVTYTVAPNWAWQIVA